MLVLLGLEWDLLDAIETEILSFHELEMAVVVAFQEEEMTELSWVSRSVVALGLLGTTAGA